MTPEGRPRVGVAGDSVVLWDTEQSGKRASVHGVHGARALEQHVDVEVGPQALEHVDDGGDRDCQAGTVPAQAAEALALAGGGQVLAGRPGHDKECCRGGEPRRPAVGAPGW